jgi:transmembrane protein
MPSVIRALLKARVFHLVARIVLTTPFWGAGIQHAVQWSSVPAEMTHFGLNPPVLYGVALLVTCFVGSLLVILGGRLTWLGAGALGIFTALTIPIAHAFWAMQGDAAMNEFRTVMEHVSIIGGLMVVAAMEANREA